ncbi:MAG TPA: nucleotidyltransferase [Chitinophagales bacterium]|nr:nucleotidyltransferase [Chitinophagales bacterium]
MNLLIDAHRQLLKAMLNNNVDFIVIGGYAVIFHGYDRTTGDIDFWIKPDNANKPKLIEALREFGIEETSLADVGTLDFTKTIFFNIGEEPERIDFLTRINLISYEEADRDKTIAEVDELKMPFLHLNHLILSKINTERPQDKADVDMLQKIAKHRNNS